MSAMDPDSEDIELLETVNEFSLGNSFWFTVGTLMQQGSDLNPKVNVYKSKTKSSLSAPYCKLTVIPRSLFHL